MDSENLDWKIDGGLYINSYHYKSLSFKDLKYLGVQELDNNKIVIDFFEVATPSRFIYTLVFNVDDHTLNSGIFSEFVKDSEAYNVTHSYQGTDQLAMRITIINSTDGSEVSEEIVPIKLSKLGMLKNTTDN